tara:strand:+ start:150 stop:707 length:558 start_codon:yes stop_codon:yes gene_type:complete
MSTNFIQVAKDYATYHTHHTTKIIHAVGLILIIFSMQIFFGFVQISMPNVFSTDLAWLLSLILLGYYAKLQWRLTLLVAPVFYFLNYAATLISSNGPTGGATETCFLLLLFGIIAQFIGHAYEKKRPPMKQNLTQLFLSPLFLVAEIAFYFSMMRALYLAVYEIDEASIEKENKKRFEENNEESE